jgi:hypothetical protein
MVLSEPMGDEGSRDKQSKGMVGPLKGLGPLFPSVHTISPRCAYSYIMKMEARCSSETLVSMYQTTQCHISYVFITTTVRARNLTSRVMFKSLK